MKKQKGRGQRRGGDKEGEGTKKGRGQRRGGDKEGEEWKWGLHVLFVIFR
jgi:hypothetical protein